MTQDNPTKKKYTIPAKFKYIVRVAPKELFNKPVMLHNGFAINHYTVLFDFIKEKMEITYFEDAGKMVVRNLSIPENKATLLTKMRLLGNEEILQRQIVDKNFIKI